MYLFARSPSHSLQILNVLHFPFPLELVWLKESTYETQEINGNTD
jgi:hypothetical protein